MSQRKKLKARQCNECGKKFTMTAAEIKAHAKICWQERRQKDE